MRYRGVLAVAVVCIATRLAAAQTEDERHIAELTRQFFAAYDRGDAAEVARLVSPVTPHRADLLLAPSSDRGPSRLPATVDVRGVRSTVTRAVADVVIEIAEPNERQADGRALLHAERLLLWVHEMDGWRLWKIGPGLVERAERVASAVSSDDERRSSLLEDIEFIGADLWPVLLSMGERLFQRGKYAEADRIYTAAGEVAGAIQSRAGVAAASRGTGNVRFYRGEHEAALRAYRYSVQLGQLGADRRDIYRGLNGIGNVQAALGRTSEALGSYEESLSLAEALGDDAGIAIALNNIANVEMTRGNHAAALRHYRRGLEMKESAGDRAGISIALYNIGRVLLLQRDYEGAREHQRRSLKLAETLERTAGVASIHRALGEISDRLGEQALAIHHYEQSAAAALQIGDVRSRVEDLLRLGRIWRSRGEPTRSHAVLDEALAIAERSSLAVGQVRAIAQLGLSWEAAGARAHARSAYERVRALADRIGDRIAAANALARLARLSTDGGRHHAALRELDQAEAAVHQSRDLRGLAALTVLRGRVYLALGRPDEAAAAARRSSQLARVSGDGLAEADAALLSGSIASDRGQLAAARESIERAIQLLEGVAWLPDDTWFGIGTEPSELERSAYLAGIELMLSQRLVVQAWDFARRYRASVVRRVLAGDRRLGAAEFSQARRSEPLRGVSPGSPATSTPGATLAYVVSDSQVHVFVHTRNGAHDRERIWSTSGQIDTAKLDALTADLQQDAPDVSLDRRLDAARALYDLLIEPAESRLREVRELSIHPDGPLWAIPFELLQQRSGRFLVERYVVSYVTGIDRPEVRTTRLSPRNGTDELARSSSALFLAGGASSPVAATVEALDALTRDERARREQLDELVRLYGDPPPLALASPIASMEDVAAVDGRYRVLHVDAPAVLDDHDPMRSAILLRAAGEEDGSLEPADIAALHLSADVVILASPASSMRAGPVAGRAILAAVWAWRARGAELLVTRRNPSADTAAWRAIHESLAALRTPGSPSAAVAAATRQLQLAAVIEFRRSGRLVWPDIALFRDAVTGRGLAANSNTREDQDGRSP